MLQLSFSRSSYIRAFYTQFTGGEGISSGTGNTIEREQFFKGHTLYCFDLTSDLSSSCGHHFSVTKSGNLRLELGFELALSITGNVLVYSECDNVIEIDKDSKGDAKLWTLNTFDILAMLDVPVLPADHVRGYIEISMMVQYEPSMDTGQWTLGSNGLSGRRGLFI